MMPPMVIIETWRGRSEQLSAFRSSATGAMVSFIAR
jgi:hypothetical protein